MLQDVQGGDNSAEKGPQERPAAVEIRKVDRDTDLAKALLDFVRNFSWEDAKEHILWLLSSWAFQDWEAVFAAVADGQIVGMASIMRTDYYPLPEIYPWRTNPINLQKDLEAPP